MKLLLTSAGISNPSIKAALEEMLPKPINECKALYIATGMYPFRGGGEGVVRSLSPESPNPLTLLGWKSLGLLELTALPTIRRENWVADVLDADVLLVYGGNVLYLKYWMQKSGLVNLFPELDDTVYVGVSAGSIVMTAHNCDVESNIEVLPDDPEIVSDGEKGLGLVDCALWVHLDNPSPIFSDHTSENIEEWSSTISSVTYAIDDQTALRVEGDHVDVVSEGSWESFGRA